MHAYELDSVYWWIRRMHTCIRLCVCVRWVVDCVTVWINCALVVWLFAWTTADMTAMLVMFIGVSSDPTFSQNATTCWQVGDQYDKACKVSMPCDYGKLSETSLRHYGLTNWWHQGKKTYLLSSFWMGLWHEIEGNSGKFLIIRLPPISSCIPSIPTLKCS